MKEFIDLLPNDMTKDEARLDNAIVLAFVGDSLYCSYVRVHLALKSGKKARGLHLLANSYVKAQSQALAFHTLVEENYFTETELGVANRARNAKLNHVAKNASLDDYKHATAYESVLGYLFFASQKARLLETIERAVKIIDENLKNGSEECK